MEKYKFRSGPSSIIILTTGFVGIVLSILLLITVSSYVLASLVKIFLVGFFIYIAYYFLLSTTLKCEILNDKLIISSFLGLRKRKIYIKNINNYQITKGKIKGVKLSGLGQNKFLFGKSLIDNIGLTKTYITNYHSVIYLKTSKMVYAISPDKIDEVVKILEMNGVQEVKWECKKNSAKDFHKDKNFIIPFFLVTIIVAVLTLNPFILYLKRALPENMPLVFNANFEPIKYGTGKEFAFNQMFYGALNMIVFFFMYYAAYFHAKYDKKSAYKYIYISLIIAVSFLFMQIRILGIYR